MKKKDKAALISLAGFIFIFILLGPMIDILYAPLAWILDWVQHSFPTEGEGLSFVWYILITVIISVVGFVFALVVLFKYIDPQIERLLKFFWSKFDNDGENI